jgi:SAM-dependent methyltransferase
MNILLGCGAEFRPGWVHVDRYAGGHVGVVYDLDVLPWPFADQVAERIEAIDVLEHLADTVAFMNECWRILKPSGTLLVQAVGWQSENLWRDPTHKRGFHPDTFRYFDPSSSWYQSYGRFYTDYPWQVLWVEMRDGNVVAEMRPIVIPF